MMGSILFNDENRLRNGWRILIFFLIFFASLFLKTILLPQIDEILVEELLFLLSVIISTLIVMHFLERKNFLEVGLKVKRKTIFEIYYGLILGFLMIAAVVIPNALLGYYVYNCTLNQIFPQILNSIIFFLFVAFAEEILFRGYPFQRLIDGTSPFAATLIFSSLFSIAHFQNPNISLVALINIFLAGIWLSVAYIKTHSLWLPISLHFSWNFFQGYLFSLPVSGIKLYDTAFEVEITSENLISGGSFGPEGSVLTSLVLGIATILIQKNERLSHE